ncbi:MAG: hypothetical protein KC561_21180, partial [Myxococcales bacterium]|nr:hypothetical protein [Myxococcales bacterium]
IDHREDRNAPPEEGVSGRAKGGDYRSSYEGVQVFAVEPRLGPHITTQGHGFRCAARPID